jgi:hypothetical protein
VFYLIKQNFYLFFIEYYSLKQHFSLKKYQITTKKSVNKPILKTGEVKSTLAAC